MKRFIDKYYNIITVILLILSMLPSFYTLLSQNANSKPVSNQNSTEGFNGFLYLNKDKIFIFSVISLIVIIILYLWFRLKHRNIRLKSNILDENSTYIQSIYNIVQQKLQEDNIVVPLSNYKNINVNDLTKICNNLYYSSFSKQSIEQLVNNARAFAFTVKYSTPRKDDEKQMELPGLENWKVYFNNLLIYLGINDINSLTVLNVGIGNGYESKGLFNNITNFIGVDISEKALQYARKNFSNMKTFVNSSEKLNDINNISIDLYISLRTFQSSLLDIREAVHEAYRVLKPGGIIIISIPDLYVKNDGQIIKGLQLSNSNQVEQTLNDKICNEIKDLLEMLLFENIYIDKYSPYEVYITGKKGN